MSSLEVEFTALIFRSPDFELSDITKGFVRHAVESTDRGQLAFDYLPRLRLGWA